MSVKRDNHFHILLADDDPDDQMLFKDAVSELVLETPVKLHLVNNGNELMEYLQEPLNPLPSLLFLDLNMPVKNGFECLYDIRQNPSLKNITVVIYSTTGNSLEIDDLYKKKADLFLNKPNSFSELETSLKQIIDLGIKRKIVQPGKANFVFRPGLRIS
jgi:CheY-like chemotaxis protein